MAEISVPTGGGALAGIGETFQPDLHTGTGNFSVPVPLPPGRNKLTPTLTLAYSSGNGNGPFGLGWSLAVPRIARRTDRGIPTFDDDADVFVLSGAEELAPVPFDGSLLTDLPVGAVLTRYRPRTEATWARILHVVAPTDDYWDVWSKDGLRSRYGTRRPTGSDAGWTDPASICRPDGRVFAWLLSRTEDSLGNHIAYGYAADGTAQLSLSTVQYVDYGDAAAPAYAVTVSISYEPRPDPFSDRKAGFEVRTAQRATRIDIATVGSGGDPVTSVTVAYAETAAAVSVVSEITVTGRGESADDDVSYPPITLGYRDWQPQSRTYRTVAGELPPQALAPGMELVDLFADGLPSVIELDTVARYWRNRGGDFDPPRAFSSAPSDARLGAPNTALLDVDGDGRPDVVVTDASRSTVWTLAADDGGRAGFVAATPLTGGVPSVGFTDASVRILDLNADHLADLLIGGQTPTVAYGNGTGGFAQPHRLVNPPPPLSIPSDPHVFFADFSGDGLTDVALIHNGSVRYWPSLGGGAYDMPVQMADAPVFADAALYAGTGFDPRRLLIGSVTGLGAADIVYVGDGSVTIWLNQSGNGFSEPTVIRGTPRIANQTGVRLADLDGIGVSGILWSGIGTDGHWAFLDLTGGAKPYLMTDIDNNSGARTILTWSTSTAYAVADRAAGKPWRTTLPFPVHVIATSQSIDAFAHTTLTSAYTYHEGYWDPGDWEYRGFACVEQSDTLVSTRSCTGRPGSSEPLDPLTPRSPVAADFDAAAHGNLVTNWSFDAPGSEPTSFTTTPSTPAGPSSSAAPGWGLWHNAATTTTTELVKSDLPQGPSGQMLHVVTGAPGCGLVQVLSAVDTGPTHVVASAWIRVVRGTVGVGTGNGGNTSVDVTTDSAGWMLVSAGNIQTPANELIVYATSDGGAEFYIDHVWVRDDDLADDPLTSPPLRTVTWYHVGPVGPAHGAWTELDYARDYWSGDLPPYSYLDTSLLPDGMRRDLLREVLRGLRGRVLRSELYADDGTSASNRPYEVHDSAIRIMPVRDGRTADDESWMTHPVVCPQDVMSRSAMWDRGTDPMIHFTHTDYDDDDRPIAVVDAGVARDRTDPLAPGSPCLATVTYTDYATRDDAVYRLDRVARTRKFEAVDGGTGSVLAFLAAAASGARNGSLRSLELTYYDGDPLVGLPNGQLGDHSLPVRTEHLVATPDFLDSLTEPVRDGATATSLPPYLDRDGTVATAAQWAGYPDAFREAIQDAAAGPHLGFVWHEADTVYVKGYYAQSSRIGYDIQVPGSETSCGLAVLTRDAHGGQSTTEWDQYAHLPTKTVDPLGLTTSAEYDERHFKPRIVTDPNANQTQIGYSPLGLPTWIAKTGKEGASEGDTIEQPGQTFVYDFTAPIRVHAVRRVDHRWSLVDRANAARHAAGEPALTEQEIADMFPPTELTDHPDRFIISTEYSDGHGRLLQKRTQADDRIVSDVGLPLDGSAAAASVSLDPPTAEPRVVVSSWKIYDNKGRAVIAYEPFFSTGYDYQEPDAATLDGLAAAVQRYDARGRVFAAIAPDGSERRTVYGIPTALSTPVVYTPSAWETYAYDAIDNAGRTHPTTSLESVARWDTPSSSLRDALGRTVTTVQRGLADDVVTTHTYDIDGHVLMTVDPLHRTCAVSVYDCTGTAWLTWLLDAGSSRAFHDAAGGVVEHRDDKGAVTLSGYDVGHRPTRVWAVDDPAQPDAALRVTTLFGDDPASGMSVADAVSANALGRVVAVYDEAGAVKTTGYDLDGNPLDATRLVVRPDVLLSGLPAAGTTGPWAETAFIVDWTPPAGGTIGDREAVLLDTERFETTTEFDALGRRVSVTAPVDATGARALTIYTYGRGGGIDTVTVDGRTSVGRITYNAHGQRTLAALGNGVLLRYAYDPRTLRLRRTHAQHATLTAPTWTTDGDVLQDLTHRFDVGAELLTIRDQAPGSGLPIGADPIHSSSPDTIDRQFAYDALNRLLSGTGRETDILPDQPWLAEPRTTDVTKARPYTENYTYDVIGNLVSLDHQTDQNATGAYTRSFGLASGSNQLSTMTTAQLTASYTFDAAGNQLSEFANRLFEWDHANRLAVFRNQAGTSVPSVYAQYRYDASGERVMKLVKKPGSLEITVYAGSLVRVYIQQSDGSWIGYDTLEVVDGTTHVASITRGDALPGDPLAGHSVQYHLTDHIGSVSGTLDADGSVLNREEYLPYGETAFGSVAYKRYRFTGKERDAESGLNYHSARYYAPWLGRWVAVDPLKVGGGYSQYAYVACHPTTSVDPTGKYEESGHYYTAYFVLLAVGMPASVSFRSAVFAQLPDEVKEYDATSREYAALGSSLLPNAAEAATRRDNVQQRIHALTGNSPQVERAATRAALANATPGSPEFGMLIHRFGDTFAHTMVDEDKNYSTGLGHAVEFLNLRDPHIPDKIEARPGLYTAYAQSLYATLSGIARANGYEPRISMVEFTKIITQVSKEPSSASQIQALREAAASIGSPMDSIYRPEKEEAASLKEYDAHHPGFANVNGTELDKAMMRLPNAADSQRSGSSTVRQR